MTGFELWVGICLTIIAVVLLLRLFLGTRGNW